jgi:hypothetical protein
VIGVVYVLAAAIVALAGLSVYLAVTAITNGKGWADSRELAAQRAGLLELAAEKMREANDATKTAVDAEKVQETRANTNEKEVADAQVAADPAGALGRLRELSDAADPGPGTNKGGPGKA